MKQLVTLFKALIFLNVLRYVFFKKLEIIVPSTHPFLVMFEEDNMCNYIYIYMLGILRLPM